MKRRTRPARPSFAGSPLARRPRAATANASGHDAGRWVPSASRIKGVVIRSPCVA